MALSAQGGSLSKMLNRLELGDSTEVLSFAIQTLLGKSQFNRHSMYLFTQAKGV